MHAMHSYDSTTIGAMLETMTRDLQSASQTPRLDAETLVTHVTGLTRSDIIAKPHLNISANDKDCLNYLLARRKHREPVAYLTGCKEFWSLNLDVSPATLIPRAETELLVELALQKIPQNAEWNIADIGTGCGAIALAVAKERLQCHVVATDLSKPALCVARLNAQKFDVSQIEFLEGNWFAPLALRKFNLILSNPPYVAVGDPHLEQGDLQFEPSLALISGPDGLSAIRHIARHAITHLLEGGWLILEHGWDQAQAVNHLLSEYGYYNIACHPDLAGNNRITECQK